MKFYKRTMWGGFIEGKLSQGRIDDYFGGSNVRVAPAIFYTRREAREQYQDVRKIQIEEVRKCIR